MQTEDNELLPLSALQHYAYCPRQFALIHIEQQWAENRFTAEGQVLHERVNSGVTESRGDLHIARSTRLVSQRLGLIGIADLIEFHRTTEGNGARLAGRSGYWQPFPVEYKRGRAKADDWDRLQLCAQALCLEEMLDVAVPEGALFYGKPRRREQVIFVANLRAKTCELSLQMHQLWGSGQTPAPEPGPRCDRCSLQALCLPRHASVKLYLERMLEP